MQPETALQRRIVTVLQKEGCYAMRQRLSGRRGWPDIYAILPCGHPCHLEVKTERGVVAAMQTVTLAALERAGAITGVVDGYVEALQLVYQHLERCPIRVRRRRG